MSRFQRSDRVKEVVRRAISQIIENELWDERVNGVTVTGVDVSRDLKYAKVYFSILGDDQAISDASDALNSAAGLLRSRLGDAIRLRYTPELQFRYDSTLANGMHMDRLLEELNRDS